MRTDVIVKVFGGVLIAAGLILAALIFLLWKTIFGPLTDGHPLMAALGGFIFFIFCVPQIAGGLMSWRYGSVVKEMAAELAAPAGRHMALRIAMGIVGLFMTGVLGLTGVTFLVDFGFSGVCGIILIILAVLGPAKVAGRRMNAPLRKASTYLFHGQTTSLCETCYRLVPAKIIIEDGCGLLPQALQGPWRDEVAGLDRRELLPALPGIHQTRRPAPELPDPHGGGLPLGLRPLPGPRAAFLPRADRGQRGLQSHLPGLLRRFVDRENRRIARSPRSSG